MLIDDKEALRRNHRLERRLLQDETRYSGSLACWTCPQRGICGGLNIGVGSVSCLDFCCGGGASCNMVCLRRTAAFVESVREIGGFELGNVPPAPKFAMEPLPSLVPVFYHGNARASDYEGAAVCLPFFRVVRADGRPKFRTEAALRARFRIAPSATLILSGTAKDNSLEAWWNLSPAFQREVIKALRGLGIALVSTPNFSLFTSSPRWDDMHNMKRIGLLWSEFQNAGMPTALHVNGRTERDAERWAEFVRERPEITSIAFEFGTGGGRGDRRALHTGRLVEIASHAGRPLQLLVRGAIGQMPELRKGFGSVTLLDTTAFMRTMHRRRAERDRGGSLAWTALPTFPGEPLDELLSHNIAALQSVAN